ncbi:putative methyltransferase-domain-containing protein [Phlebopus sp. FC_14]|nr:putative methyltransferase-domain-containing protein [Phlebopus sp. FC_14]
MPKARKKQPITSTGRHAPSSSSNPHATRTLIRRFHVLLKKQRQLQDQKNTPNTSNLQQLHDVEQEIEDMGGLAAYQRMSDIGQGSDRGGGSEKVLIKWLSGFGHSRGDNTGKLRLLEVGALKPDNYTSCASWLDAMSIDLRSRHPSIIEQDFLSMPTDEHREKWDLISLSLVVNFVPDPNDRGRMLILSHTFLRPSGLLFLVLPLPCVENSRYFTFDLLQSLMDAIGFMEIEKKWKKGGKMAYWLYRKVQNDRPAISHNFRKKSVCREGRRNNFTILLP